MNIQEEFEKINISHAIKAMFFTIEKCTKFQSKTVPLNAKKINKL